MGFNSGFKGLMLERQWFEPWKSGGFLQFLLTNAGTVHYGVQNQLRPPITNALLRLRSCCISLVILNQLSAAVKASFLHKDQSPDGIFNVPTNSR